MSKDVAVASVRARAPTRARADVEAYRLTLTDHNRRRPSPSRLSRPSSTASRHRHFDSHVRSRPFKVQIARRKQAFRRQRREQLGACCTRRRPLGRASCCAPQQAKRTKKRRKRPSGKAGIPSTGQAVPSAGPSTAAATGGKRKRRLHEPSEPAPSDDGGLSESSVDAGDATSAVEESASSPEETKGKERALPGGRRRSKRSRSSVEHEPAVDEAGPSTTTTSPFFAAARRPIGAPSTGRTPTTDADDELEEVEANLAAGRETTALPPFSALALGLRAAASPSAAPGSPARSPRPSPIKSEAVLPTKPAAKKQQQQQQQQQQQFAPPAFASIAAAAVAPPPAKPTVDPALRERAVRLKLVEDLAKEKRERDEEVAGLRAEMDQLRKEVGFKDSVRAPSDCILVACG
jgi:hypothetical protein